MAQFLQRTGRSRDGHRDIRFSKDFHENVASLIASLTPRLRIHGIKSKAAEEEARLANKSTAQFLKRSFSLMDRGCVITGLNLIGFLVPSAHWFIYHSFKLCLSI